LTLYGCLSKISEQESPPQFATAGHHATAKADLINIASHTHTM